MRAMVLCLLIPACGLTGGPRSGDPGAVDATGPDAGADAAAVDAAIPSAPDAAGVGPDGLCVDEPETLVRLMSDLGPTYDVEVTSQYVYLATYDGVFRADKCNGAGKTELVTAFVDRILADEDDLYYYDVLGRVRVARDGDDPVVFATTSTGDGMTRDDEAIYTSHAQIYRVPKDGSPATLIVPPPLHWSRIEHRAGLLYYVGYEGPSGLPPMSLYSTTTTGTGRVLLASDITDIMIPVTPVADDTHIYLVSIEGISRVPIGGGPEVTLHTFDSAVTPFIEPAPLAVDDVCVYYIANSYDFATNVWTGQASCWSKADGTTIGLLTITGSFRDIEVDPAGVYVTADLETGGVWGDGWVGRLPHPSLKP